MHSSFPPHTVQCSISVTVTTSNPKIEVYENTSKYACFGEQHWLCGVSVSSALSLVVSSINITLFCLMKIDAVLSCKFQTEKETNPRIEWKKKGYDVSYVYFDREFNGEFFSR